jgi:hypothetical protein
MQTLPKLWRSLDRVAGQLAVSATWALEAGEDFEFLRPHLRPTDMVGALYPCPHRYGNCPRKIVDYDNGEFAAICRDQHQSCDRVPLTVREALVHELDLASFLRPILLAISIRREEPQKRGFATWSLGLSARRSSLNQRAFLIVAHRTESFESAVNDLLADVVGQFLVLAPTNKFRTAQVQARLQTRKIGYLCLEEQVGIDVNGGFVSIDPLESTDSVQATPVADRKRVIAAFRSRHGCKVAEIHEAAGVHEADYYKWLNGSIPDHYSTCVAIEKVLAAGIPKRAPRKSS